MNISSTQSGRLSLILIAVLSVILVGFLIVFNVIKLPQSDVVIDNVPPESPENEITGIIKSINSSEVTITVQGEDKTFAITPMSVIQQELIFGEKSSFRPAYLADMKDGAEVTVEVDGEKLTTITSAVEVGEGEFPPLQSYVTSYATVSRVEDNQIFTEIDFFGLVDSDETYEGLIEISDSIKILQTSEQNSSQITGLHNYVPADTSMIKEGVRLIALFKVSEGEVIEGRQPGQDAMLPDMIVIITN